MTRAPAKAWLVAVAISLCAHVALLGALALVAHHVLAPAVAASTTSPSPVPKRGPVMRVSVRSAAHPALGRPLEGAPTTASPHLPAKRRTEQPEAPTSASPMLEREPTEPAAEGEVAAEATGSGSTGSSGEQPSGESVGPSGSASGATGAAATAGPPSQVSAQVHARLADAAAGCYPAAARRFRQRGTVTVTFCVTANLAGSAPEVRQSSGLGVLDAASACVVEHAAPFPAEAALQCFTVPIRFGK